jgi:transcriptional regulator with XRE-family HTH domain
VPAGEWVELTKLQSVLRALRQSQGLTLDAAADKLGWSRRKLWLLETSSVLDEGHGHRGTTVYALFEYAELLGHRIETRVVIIGIEDEWRREAAEQ